MTKIDFSTKIHAQRPYESKNFSKSTNPASLQRAFESDRGRIINSAAIRRLQQKTQVFPLEKNAAVRSRLTHSMEVQQVGRFIVQTIFSHLSAAQLKLFGLTHLERCIESVVEMSCLMHDIGNPPFGHFGEQAINQWFALHLTDLSKQVNEQDTDQSVFQHHPQLASDLLQFEGNAQAIRLISSLLNLNLTYTQAAGILKYTRPGTAAKSATLPTQSYLMKKVGYYYSEAEYISNLSECLNIDYGCRHPLSYIMEAADDISYCLADIEDAVEKGILTTDQLSQLLAETYPEILIDKFALNDQAAIDNMRKTIEKAQRSQNYFISLRVSLSHPLVKHASEQFIGNIEAIYRGSYNQALLEDKSHYHAITETLKQIAIKYVFCHREVEKLELQGYRIISGLLDCYRPLLNIDANVFNKILQQDKNAPLIARHLVKKLPEKHLLTYTKAIALLKQHNLDYPALEYYHRCRLLQDYISGMTDQFAYDEYRMLMVID